jgi:hypothetical protein
MSFKEEMYEDQMQYWPRLFGGADVEVGEDDLGPFLFYREANLTC